ncbi:DMT family transporter [Pseudemcibacter aquimaris]|uniref:DMT family transporter n=1 Tax=Pseudemcibacter aquimaris TaxID=2857064 RepID=UPI002011A0BA|nr:DMT family transporter [Pseudemcibacter aquimaris]MCC3860644.1 DMT family transporter [Pseudemcibacter aquimaris]WDU59463.1 DMT family transporter [Pseudemcibacter aquimaris]
MTENRPISHYLLLLVLAGVWGCSFLFLKIIAPTVPPFTIAAIRITIGAIVIALYVLYKREKLPTHKSIWLKGSVIGLIGTGTPFVLISWAMLYINSGTGAICMSVIPLMVFVMAHFVHHDEKMSWYGLIGILFGISGVVVLFYDSISISDEGNMGTYALIAMMAASFGYAFANILIKRFVKTDPINTSFVMLTTSAIAIWPVAFMTEQPLSIEYGTTEILSLVYLGVLPTGIATMVLVIFTRIAGSTFVSYNTYLIPIVGVIVGYIFLDEALKQTTILSIIFIALGIFISQRPRLKSRKP